MAANFTHLAASCMPWLDPIAPRIGLPSGQPCGRDTSVPCNISFLAEACLARPDCNAFNSNGFLKHCPGGRCGCDASASACICSEGLCAEDHGCGTTDLYVLSVDERAPAEWRASIANASLLFAAPEQRAASSELRARARTPRSHTAART